MILKKVKNLFKLELLCNSAKFEDQNIGPVLSPYIARDKINLFCNEVNKLTINYNNELRISLKLFLYFDNSFFFLIKGPNFANLVKIYLNCDNLVKNVNNQINLFDLYDILYLKQLFVLNISIKFNSIVLKNQILNSLNGIKNLKIEQN